jgi:phage terminase small subunit
LLRNPKVGAEIERRITKRAGRLEINVDRVLKELARLAFLDPRKFFNDDGSPKQINDLDEDTARALAGMEVMELFEGSGEQKHVYGLIRKYKLADKRGALELLGKHLKLFTDKVEQLEITNQLEKKEDMKSRGLVSPDLGNMLAMIFDGRCFQSRN